MNQYILDRNQKTMSASSHGLQGEEAGRDVSRPGTKGVGLNGGKFLPLSYFMTFRVTSFSFSNVWSKGSLIWVKHAVGKAESNSLSINSPRQLGCHAIAPHGL